MPNWKKLFKQKDQANVFAHKGKVKTCSKTYAKMAENLTEEIVDVRKEDKTIKSFTIEA